MVFSSLEFLCVFLPLFLLAYYLVPFRFKNLCLLIFSFAFYAYGTKDTPLYLLLISLSVVANYFVALWIEKRPEKATQALTVGLVLDFGSLFFFKYADFFTVNLNRLFGLVRPEASSVLPQLHLLLPIGISFYTFQIVSYLIDVYRKDVPAQHNFVDMATYILMFPQLIAGPIVRYSDVNKELETRTITLPKAIDGLKIFILGLGFKVLLANQIGNLWNDVCTIGPDSLSTPLAWMGIAAYAMQIYFDFNGYSLMAIGLGKMIGFEFPQNFNEPYSACTMTDFWRRWHITLGSWFREYVYIPLGGNRRGKLRTYFNLLVVWAFTGFWHGAEWNFLLWGIFLFVVIALEKLLWGKFFEKHRVLGHLYMLLLIPLFWLIFASEDMEFFLSYAKRLIGVAGEYVFAGDYLKYGNIYGTLLLIGLLFCTPFAAKIYRKIRYTPLTFPLLTAVICLSIYCLYIGLNDPFLYFRF